MRWFLSTYDIGRSSIAIYLFKCAPFYSLICVQNHEDWQLHYPFISKAMTFLNIEIKIERDYIFHLTKILCWQNCFIESDLQYLSLFNFPDGRTQFYFLQYSGQLSRLIPQFGSDFSLGPESLICQPKLSMQIIHPSVFCLLCCFTRLNGSWNRLCTDFISLDQVIACEILSQYYIVILVAFLFFSLSRRL